MSIPILGVENAPDLQEMQIRLLVCDDCHSIDELPDHEGSPESDTLLNVLVERHRHPSGTEHLGRLFKVPLKFWANPKVKDGIVKQIAQQASKGIDDISPGYYDTVATFQEDAMSCFAQHLRPAGRCPDWKHESKRLIPKTAEERKDAGLAKPGETGPQRHLCDFCPAALFMHKKMRELRGQYT